LQTPFPVRGRVLARAHWGVLAWPSIHAGESRAEMSNE